MISDCDILVFWSFLGHEIAHRKMSPHTIAIDTPTSRDTSSMEALLGGSSLATTFFLIACPNRAIASSHPRPQFLGSMESTTILTLGGGSLVDGRLTETVR